VGEKILFLATVDDHIYSFHIPFMKLLKDMGFEVEVFCRDTGFAGKIRKEKFVVYNVPFARNPLSISNLKAFVILLNLLKSKNYRMIHTHTPVAGFLGRLAGRMAGVPCIIYTAHGFHFHEYGNKLRNFLYFRLEKLAGKLTDVLITINKDDYRIAVNKCFVPCGKVIYLPGVGVDTGFFDPSDSLVENSGKRKDSVPKLVSIGRLEREKHYGQILRALKLVKDRKIEFKCLFVGSGKLQKALIRKSKTLGLRDNVVFTGYLEDVRPALAKASIYISASSREGLPVSVMEAMAMQKPVVAYNIRGVRDLVVDGKTGFLVSFGDVQGLAEKVCFLIQNPEVAREMGRKGRERVLKEFDLKIVMESMRKLYEEALGLKDAKGGQ